MTQFLKVLFFIKSIKSSVCVTVYFTILREHLQLPRHFFSLFRLIFEPKKGIIKKIRAAAGKEDEMELDAFDLKHGMKFIVGTWRPDYVVNFFSNDLAHIPAADFKSDDGRDLTALTFSFFEDHTVKMEDRAKGKTESGTWEQTDLSEFRFTLNSFLDLPDGPVKDAAQKLSAQNGDLVFVLGFIAIALKKD